METTESIEGQYDSKILIDTVKNTVACKIVGRLIRAYDYKIKIGFEKTKLDNKAYFLMGKYELRDDVGLSESSTEELGKTQNKFDISRIDTN